MQRIGLTGGIAAGKSVAARRLAELGAVVIDSDVAGAAGGRARVGGSRRRGRGVRRSPCSRPTARSTAARSARIVFSDPAPRARLDAIVHPIVRRLSAEQSAAAGAVDHGAVVVHDIPLLVETGQARGLPRAGRRRRARRCSGRAPGPAAGHGPRGRRGPGGRAGLATPSGWPSPTSCSTGPGATTTCACRWTPCGSASRSSAPTSSPRETPVILLTGFEPFEDQAENASWLAVREVAAGWERRAARDP